MKPAAEAGDGPNRKLPPLRKNRALMVRIEVVRLRALNARVSDLRASV